VPVPAHKGHSARVQALGTVKTASEWQNPGALLAKPKVIAPQRNGVATRGQNPSHALVLAEPAFTEPEQLALAGFLACYNGLTREAYILDLRQFSTWCHRAASASSRCAGPTSSASPATSRSKAAPAPPSPGVWPP
jgi:hypothetical protein